MAEEETDKQPETADETSAAPEDVVTEQPAAEPDAAVEESAPEAEAETAPETEPEAEAEAETAPEAEDEPASEAEAAAAPAAAPAHKPEPAEVIAPKERRRRKRAAKAPAARAATSPEDRQAERTALRAKNAKARRTERLKARAEKPVREVVPAAPVEHAAGRPKARQGVVVSDKAAKTITVRVDTSRRHRRYKKIVRSSKTLHAHDEHNEAHEGDLVRVVETRPLSATKRWRLIEVLERAK
jgi:small subunit ribosomal protein S17